ncbi:linker for activation of T-cells family member 1 isoform X2 [Perognathus longimembris pacificus]|uniref:linker for activation of T-cells family member 1 isoform X2 n=1 Tax=Perognathus longimembris pacificus TaxID=214514 RepID=UPI002018D385|nr:linker for activation of T-cells family member 1 isoform X2 [Perognathus longimembris pacificus]
METSGLTPFALGLLLLPVLATLLAALCARCRELPASTNMDSADSLYPRSILIKPPHTPAHWPPVTSYPPLTRPDLLPIPRSPQPLVGSHQLPSSQQDSDGANSVASYENQEPVCEDEEEEEEDEDDYPNEGYLVVLPDSTPATSPAVASAPVPSNPGLRDSAFSMESGEDYVNVPESGESADASLDGSREYVNVGEDLPPEPRMEPAALSPPEVEEEEEEEGEAPDYENV